jgi:hypothetical protein
VVLAKETSEVKEEWVVKVSNNHHVITHQETALMKDSEWKEI